MKPFNLEKFLAGEPAITRDGRKVIDWHYFKDVNYKYKLACVINGNIIFYSDKGNTDYSDKENLNSPIDLFMEEKEVDLWIATYKSQFEDDLYLSTTFRTQATCDLFLKINQEYKVTVTKITIKE